MVGKYPGYELNIPSFPSIYNKTIIIITLRFDSAVQCHLTARLFCEGGGGGGVRFIPA